MGNFFIDRPGGSSVVASLWGLIPFYCFEFTNIPYQIGKFFFAIPKIKYEVIWRVKLPLYIRFVNTQMLS
ncbi:hypothetical protein MRB53_030686 [Persea americana]|uniref:Uncharacterized protein n=1 Tax=Persea americana TaxID=3435 RepID=A0ACC2KMZ2_PERAE|nr:hypothetical protein MRB53_030686 [Persea americana]